MRRANRPIPEFRFVETLIPNSDSTCVPSARELFKLRKLIERFGQMSPILIDDRNEIVDGHAVFEVLKQLDYPIAWVVVVTRPADAKMPPWSSAQGGPDASRE